MLPMTDIKWFSESSPQCQRKLDVTNKRAVYVLYERPQRWKSAWIEIDANTEKITAYGNTRWKERYSVRDKMELPRWAEKLLESAPRMKILG